MREQLGPYRQLAPAARDRYLATFTPAMVLGELIAIYEKTVASGIRD